MSKDSIMNLAFDVKKIGNEEKVFSERLKINFTAKEFQSSVVNSITSRPHTKAAFIGDEELKAICVTIKSMIAEEHADVKNYETTGMSIMLSFMREQIASNIVKYGREDNLKRMMAVKKQLVHEERRQETRP